MNGASGPVDCPDLQAEPTPAVSVLLHVVRNKRPGGFPVEMRSFAVSDTVRLEVGDPAPDFTLTDDAGARVSLRDLRGTSVIVYFYPAAMTPGCTKQACDFTDSLASLRGAGFEVLGISPDSPAKLAKFREKDGLGIRLLSDPDKATMTAYGAFGEKSLYGRLVTGVIRSTFVVDPDGSVALAQYNVKATGHVAKLRRDLGLEA